MSTLANIRTKIRRLTGRTSTSDITDAQLDDYVNTYYIYDFPETLRENTLRTTFEFMTTPNVHLYPLADMPVEWGGITESAVNVYYDFQPPYYVAGYPVSWTQSPAQFNSWYPPVAQLQQSVVGDGTPGPYTIQFTGYPILQDSVSVGVIDDTGDTVKLVDSPVSRETGNLVFINTTVLATGSVDYLTGEITVTFANNIPLGEPIAAFAVQYNASRPQSILFYNNTFEIRPVPNAPYLVRGLAYITPTLLITSGQSPELKQWWQLLAYGAAKKIFEDVQDTDGINGLMPALKEQENLVLRRSIVQNTVMRTPTIFSEGRAYSGWGTWPSIPVP